MTTEQLADELTLLSVSDLARVLRTSNRTIWRLLAAGKLPEPVRLGARPRWTAETLRQWVRAGMPGAKGCIAAQT